MHVVADDNHVSVAYTLTGTHEGDFHGIAATGEHIEIRGVQIGRFENGKIVERWGSTDELWHHAADRRRAEGGRARQGGEEARRLIASDRWP